LPDTLVRPSSPTRYDYIFVGTGASAALLLLQLEHRRLLADKKVLLIDRDIQSPAEKTFCFWAESQENIVTSIQPLLAHSWSILQLPDGRLQSLEPLEYYQLNSSSLLAEVRTLAQKYGWPWMEAQVERIYSDDQGGRIRCGEETFVATWVFDSRTPQYLPKTAGEIHLFQSFIGWTVRFEQALSQPAAMRLMDFDVPQQGHTQFMYVLPFDEHTALVELTRFGSSLVEPAATEEILDAYIQQHFGHYTRLSDESGCIPMSNGRIDRALQKGVIPLGARNYNIKPSTGYAFKNMFQQAVGIAELLANEPTVAAPLNQLEQGPKKNRFGFYDGLLLHILENKPELGKPIFEQLFRLTPAKDVFRFLEEKSSWREDIRLFSRLPWLPFLQALAYQWSQKPLVRPLGLLLLSLVFGLLEFSNGVQNTVAYTLLAAGMLWVGFPHGAVDHLLKLPRTKQLHLPTFVLSYLGQAALVGVVWFFFPSVALVGFLVYSAWHFGEADGMLWGLSKPLSFVWGSSLLLYLLSSHTTETNLILAQIGTFPWLVEISAWAMTPWLVYAVYTRKYSLLLTTFWLMLASGLPLLVAFGLYFIGQHSLTGWQHLRERLRLTSRQLWLQALPFHLGAWVLLLGFYYLWPDAETFAGLSRWGLFFIFLSCISFPHVLAMHALYKSTQNGTND